MKIFVQFWNYDFWNKHCCGWFLGNFWENWATFSLRSGHTCSGAKYFWSNVIFLKTSHSRVWEFASAKHFQPFCLQGHGHPTIPSIVSTFHKKCHSMIKKKIRRQSLREWCHCLQFGVSWKADAAADTFNLSIRFCSPKRFYMQLLIRTSVTSKKSPNVYKSCPKMISLEKWTILTPLQKFTYRCGRFGQNNCCQRLWKVAQSAKNCPIWSY